MITHNERVRYTGPRQDLQGKVGRAMGTSFGGRLWVDFDDDRTTRLCEQHELQRVPAVQPKEHSNG